MFFSIDFDTRKVECRAEESNDDELAEYIIGNELTLALAYVESSDDISDQMSLEEINSVINNISTNKVGGNFKDEWEAGDRLWELLVNSHANYPMFTAKLGKKLLKEAAKRNNEKPEKIKKKVKTDKPIKQESSNIRWSAKSLSGKLLANGTNEPKEGTAHHINWYFIDENLGEANFEELLENFCFVDSCDEKKALSYITGGIRKGILEVII